tara:strand:+ start:1011 stop:1172 length:162 start_codon:yes stop_codon:yes gene_type:complete
MKRSAIYRRNLQILRYSLEHPELSLEEIGKKFGLTKQSISMILKSMEIEEVVK